MIISETTRSSKHMYKVPFLDVNFTYNSISEEINKSFANTMESGYYIGGIQVTQFEDNFAAYCEKRYCISFGNGYDALYCLLKSMDLCIEDEIIVSSHTFIATWLAITNAGASIVPIDSDLYSMNIDISQIEAKITSRTKAIIVVDIYGNPVQIEKVNIIAAKYNLKIICDAAQSHGALLNDNRASKHTWAATYSFYPAKNLGCFGDGGALVTDDIELYTKLKKLANYGSRFKYQHEFLGVNSRLDSIQAGFLSVKLKHLDSWNKRRAKISQLYFEGLSDNDKLILPCLDQNSKPNWHLFVIRTTFRKELAIYLQNKGIQTAIHYPTPVHLTQAYKGFNFKAYNLKCTEQICKTCLSLPICPGLSDVQVSYVISQIRDFIKNN